MSERVRWSFVFQAEDGIRDLVRSRGLGDVYKRQGLRTSALTVHQRRQPTLNGNNCHDQDRWMRERAAHEVSPTISSILIQPSHTCEGSARPGELVVPTVDNDGKASAMARRPGRTTCHGSARSQNWPMFVVLL